MSLWLSAALAALTVPAQIPQPASFPPSLAEVCSPSALPPEPVPIEDSPVPDEVDRTSSVQFDELPGWFAFADVLALRPALDRANGNDIPIHDHLHRTWSPRVVVGHELPDGGSIRVDYRYLRSDGLVAIGEGGALGEHDVHLETHWADLAFVSQPVVDDLGSTHTQIGLRALDMNYDEQPLDGAVSSSNRHHAFSVGPMLGIDCNSAPTPLWNGHSYFCVHLDGAVLFGNGGHWSPVWNSCQEVSFGYTQPAGPGWLHFAAGVRDENTYWGTRELKEYGVFVRGALAY